jgi:hypothetical protein
MNYYRLYIDESGDHNYPSDENLKGRYLCLTGIIIDQEANNILKSKIKELQDLVGDDSEDTRFHAEDIKSGRGIFGVLHTNAEIKSKWNTILFSIMHDIDFKICAVVIDKKEHKEKYGLAALHPYHYCLNIITEQYLKFLDDRNSKGDVMAESRGKKEDRLLSNTFTGFYTEGNQFYSPEKIQNILTSKEIKIKTKAYGISGLILADILSLAVKFNIIYSYTNIEGGLKDNFVKQLSDIIANKYLSDENGEVKGFGQKFV